MKAPQIADKRAGVREELPSGPSVTGVPLHPSAIGREFRKPICPKNHDKRITGVGPQDFCRLCRNKAIRDRDRRARRAAGVLPDNVAYLPALRYWRIEADLTQLQVAEASGLRKETVIALEAQKRPALLVTRQALAAAIGVKPGVLVMRPPGEPRKKRAGYGPRKNGRTKELAKL